MLSEQDNYLLQNTVQGVEGLKRFFKLESHPRAALLTYEQPSINIWVFAKELFANINSWIVMILYTE